MSHRIVIAGAGGIGRAVALLLVEWGDGEVEIRIGDAVEARAFEAAAWIRSGTTRPAEVLPFTMPEDGTDASLVEALRGADVLLDCLPWTEAVRMARLARDHGLHYANLTEHVASSEAIAELAAGADRGFVLQTGLAPGFVDVLGHRLFLEFCRRHGVERVDSLRIRVGALPLNALPPHYYGFTWNVRGVATEYLEPAVVVLDGRVTTSASLSGMETLRLGGLVLEAAHTSGGAADLPALLAGRVRELDYKTLRHPGHWGWVRDAVAALPDGDPETRITALEAEMRRAVPYVEEDQVVIYAVVEGRDAAGDLRRRDELLVIRPRQVGRHRLRAIQLTTAAGLAESARSLLEGELTGVVQQSGIDPERWLGGPFVGRAYYDR